MSQDRYALNKQLAQMLKGGVIMDVTTPEQARIAEEAGACAVMALERIPADIRAAGGVSRMSDPKMIKGIQEAVSIPVMAKCRIGHFAEAQILEAIEIDYIDESEVLSPADDVYHIDKTKFKVPFVCGAKDLGEALRRINEGASMIRTKGEPGTGDVVQAVRHMRKMNQEIRQAKDLERHFDGLVLPGGESTVQGKLLRELGLFVPLQEKIRAGLPVMATCAGLILLAEHIADDPTVHFGTLPVTVKRNAYGRQLGSFQCTADVEEIGKQLPFTFIRAPYIEKAEDTVKVLSSVDGNIVAVRYENQLGLSFHPEVTEDNRVHAYFLQMCGQKLS